VSNGEKGKEEKEKRERRRKENFREKAKLISL
jgi:hypothetical protein